MGYIVICADELHVNGATVDNGGFEDGVLTPWQDVGSTPVMLLEQSEFHGYQYAGSYSIGLVPYPAGEEYCVTQYNLGIMASSDIVDIYYMVVYAENAEAIPMGYNIWVEDEHSHYIDIVNENYEETCPATTDWLSASCDMTDAVGILNFSDNISIYVSSWALNAGGEPGDVQATIYLDDFTYTAGATWEGFTNGDFETGDLTGWTVTGSATIDTSAVHGGTYSCYITDGGEIQQQIDLTDTEQLNIYYNIPHNDTTFNVDINTLESSTYASWTESGTTDGWYHLRLDTSGCSGSYILDIYSVGAIAYASAYVDDITTQATFDNTPNLYSTFEDGSWFHSTSGWYNSISNVSVDGGEDSSRCAYLYPGWRHSNTTYATVYQYMDLTYVDTIRVQYKIPTFNPGYYLMGGAWFKYKLEQTGLPTVSATIADADNGAITEWTTYSIDVSDLTGVYKLSLYGQSQDAGYTLHPESTIYVDNVTAFGTTINLTQQLYVRNQYDTDSRCTDAFHNDVPLASVTDRLFSHRLTDTGHFINFDELDMADEGYLHQVQHIYNVLHMKIRRVK